MGTLSSWEAIPKSSAILGFHTSGSFIVTDEFERLEILRHAIME